MTAVPPNRIGVRCGRWVAQGLSWVLRFLLLAASGLSAIAADSLICRLDDPAPVPLGRHLSILRDVGGRLTVEDLIRQGFAGFEPNTRPVPNFGYSGDVFWIRFRVRSEEVGQQVRPIVELQTSRIGDLTWHVIREGKVTYRESSGMFRPGEQRRIDSRLPALELPLQPGEEAEVILRASTPASVSFPMVLYPGFESYLRATLGREFQVSLVAGMALCVLLLSVFLAPILGNRSFHLNVGVVLANFSQMAIFMGYWTWHRLPLAEWVVLQPMLSVSYVGLAFANFFTWNTLGPEFQKSLPGRFQRWFAIFLSGLAVLAIFIPFRVIVRWNNLWAPCSLILCLAVTIWWYRAHRHLGMRLMVLVWVFDVVLDLILILQWEGAIPVIVSPLVILLAMNSMPPLLFLTVAVDSVHRWMQEAANSQRLETLLTETRLRMLRYQINPHFLFNCLNSVVGLVRQDPSRASDFVIRLARFLRISLRMGPTGETTLSEELDTAKAFLEIEQVRFGSQLDLGFEIEPETLVARVPELVLQILVENAIRHGKSDGSQPLEIRIRSSKVGARLRLEVLNRGNLPGTSSPGDRGHGIGIANLRERMSLMAPNGALFELLEVDSGSRVMARLEMPWNPAPEIPDGSDPSNPVASTGGR